MQTHGETALKGTPNCLTINTIVKTPITAICSIYHHHVPMTFMTHDHIVLRTTPIQPDRHTLLARFKDHD